MSISIFSLFSYPFTYPHTWILLLFNTLVITKEYLTKIFYIEPVKYALCILSLIISPYGIYKLHDRIKVEIEWNNISNIDFSTPDENIIIKYKKIQESVLKENPYFLYNYAAVLRELKYYRESLDIALDCRKYWSDYDLEILIGENYQHIGNYSLAESHYLNAKMMCPSRFLPLYKLFYLYKETGNNICAYGVAKEIDLKPIKKLTSAIIMMKEDIEKEMDLLQNISNNIYKKHSYIYDYKNK